MDPGPGPVQRVDERGGLRGGGGGTPEETHLGQDPDGRGDHARREAGQEAGRRQEEETIAVAVADAPAPGEQEEEHQEGVSVGVGVCVFVCVGV